MKVTVNSDDPPFFNATIQGEYKVMENLGLNENELTSLTHNAIKYSFVMKKIKTIYWNRLDNFTKGSRHNVKLFLQQQYLHNFHK